MFHGRKICLPPRRGSRLPLLSAAVVLATVLAAAAPSSSTTIRVKPDGSGDYPTIQAAIDVAVTGDVILLDTGTFTGAGNKDLDTQGKAITIASIAGAASTVIDCEGSGRGFFIHSGEDSNTVLTGTQIKNGHPADEKGGGVLCLGTSPKLIDDIFTLCYADSGGGCYLSNSTSKIIRTTFDRCNYEPSYTGTAYGGAMTCIASDLWLIQCTFVENYAQKGNVLMSVGSTVHFHDNTFDNNGWMMVGGFVYALNSELFIFGNEVTTNQYIDEGMFELDGSTAVARANLFGPAVFGCVGIFYTHTWDADPPVPVDVSLNYFRVGRAYAVSGRIIEIHRNIFDKCTPAVATTATGSVTNNVFYKSGSGCMTAAVDIEGCPAVMSKNIHLGSGAYSAAYALSCLEYGSCPMTGGSEPLFIRNYTDIPPFGYCGGYKWTRTDDPQFCDPENGNFFLSSTSPCLVENTPTLGATHGALPKACVVEDVLDVTIPPEQFVREYEKGDVIPLTGFQVTNTSNMETIVKYALTCEGPVRLSDQGNPFALKGTSPVLQPGESYTPPEAAIVVTTDDEWFDVTVQYASAYAPALLTPDTQTATILFRRTVPVLLKAFEAAYEGDAIRLKWSVAAEDGIDGWRIYRRAEGTDAQTLITTTALPGNSRDYRDGAIAGAGRYTYDLVALIDGKEQTAGTTTVTTASPGFVLRQNSPNPFAATTIIEYAIPERANVSLAIYDASGRCVRSLVEAVQDPRAGGYSISWDGTNDRGEAVASGVYVYRLKAGKGIISKKLMLLR